MGDASHDGRPHHQSRGRHDGAAAGRAAAAEPVGYLLAHLVLVAAELDQPDKPVPRLPLRPKPDHTLRRLVQHLQHSKVQGQPLFGWVSKLLLGWLRNAVQPPSSRTPSCLGSRVGQHAAIGTAAKVHAPPPS